MAPTDGPRNDQGEASRFPWQEIVEWGKDRVLRIGQAIQRGGRRLREVPAHRRNAYLAFAAVVGMLVLVGAIVGTLFGAPGAGILFALGVSGIWILVNYFTGNRILPLLAGAHPVEKSGHPEFVEHIEEIAGAADLPMPSLWVVEDEEINAFTCGRDADHAAVVVNTGSLDVWGEEELKGVLAHEMAHIKNRDCLIDTLMQAMQRGMVMSTWLALKPFEWLYRVAARQSWSEVDVQVSPSGILAVVVYWLVRALHFLFWSVLFPVTYLLRMAASRQQEYFADQTAAELVGSSEGLIAALESMQSEQAKAAQGRKSFSVGGFMNRLQSTHPPTQKRIEHLREWSGDAGG